MTSEGPLEPGSLIGNDFEIVRPLGGGGMGTVYVVRQLSTDAPRALKVMRTPLAESARLVERFVQEAQLSTRIASDHVVQIITAGLDETRQLPWLAMELLEGEDLGTAIERRGAMDVVTAQEVVGQLCHALAAAHAAGVVHRDLKPDNVFLCVCRGERDHSSW